MNKGKIIASAEGRLIKLEAEKKAHYIPIAISSNPNFPLNLKETNIVELYADRIVIRPKVEVDKK